MYGSLRNDLPYISEMSPGDLPNLPYISPMWCESACNGGEVADLDDFGPVKRRVWR